MSFFVKPGSANKRKYGGSNSTVAGSLGNRPSRGRNAPRVDNSGRGGRKMVPPPSRRSNADDEEIESSADEAEEEQTQKKRPLVDATNETQSDPWQDETTDETRLRLTKQYLDELKTIQRRTTHASGETENDDDTRLLENGMDDDFDERNLAARLERDNLMRTAKLRFQIADTFSVQPKSMRCFLPHKRSVTCIAVYSNTRVAACDKGATLQLWDVENQKRISSLGFDRNARKSANGLFTSKNGLPSHAVSLSMSPDGALLAVGCADASLRLYDTTSMTLIKLFQGHRKSVTCVAFHPGGQLLFSASADRSVKVWSVPERAYMETLFGHTDSITYLDTFLNLSDNKERCITAGGADKSIRIWKIAESTQLLYRTPLSQASVDCVRALNEDMFITGGDDASVSLYVLRKNRPLWQQRRAHYTQPASVSDDAVNGSGTSFKVNSNEQWISALACVKNADLIASGASDGVIRMWKCDGRRLTPLNADCQIDYGAGFVNDLAFAVPNQSDPLAGKMLSVAGIGQEHKWGRWFERKKSKDGVLIIPWSAPSAP